MILIEAIDDVQPALLSLTEVNVSPTCKMARSKIWACFVLSAGLCEVLNVMYLQADTCDDPILPQIGPLHTE